MSDNHPPKLAGLTPRRLPATTEEGWLTRRTYNTPTGPVLTVEIPTDIWNVLNGQGRGQNRLAAWTRERERVARRKWAESLLRQGWKPLAVSRETGVPERTVQRWRAEMQR